MVKQTGSASSTRKSLGALIPVAFYALLAAFLVIYLRNIDFSVFKDSEFAWGYVIAASIVGLAARFWQILIWIVLLKNLGATGLKRNLGQLMFVYAKSWMGRYIPGTAPWILGKIYFASKHGISKNKLAVSSLLEGALQVAVVMAVAFIMLIFDSRLDVIDFRMKILMGAILVVCIISIIPPVFNRLISIASRIVRKKPLNEDDFASSKTIALGSALYVITALLSGLSLFFIAKSVYPTLGFGEDLTLVMGAGNLAAAASMLAIFAPSGLGVREGIQLVLLSTIMPKEFALLVTVLTRLWSIAMDFTFLGLSKIFSTFNK